jgi:histidine ammonia-lyase
MEFLRPLASSAAIERVRHDFRRTVRPWNRDREMHADIESARRFLGGPAMARAIAGLA